MKKILTIIGVVLILVVCSALFVVPNNNNSNNSNDNKNDNITITTPIDLSDKTYLAFGDSITFGADYTKSYSQMENPYPELVANELNLKSYYNYGVSGATLATNTLGLGCISNYITSYSTSYDIISVMGGVNDYNRNLPLGTIDDKNNSTIYGALNVIASSLTTKFSSSYIFFITPYKAIISDRHYLTNNTQGYNLRDVANAVKDVANKYNLPVLDLFNDGQYELEMYNSNSDGIHPSQEFIQNYTAPQIAQFIKDNYNK